MKLLISAGEPSGDQRGAELLRALQETCSGSVNAFGLGGEQLASAGMRLTHNLRNYSMMGFLEIVRSLKLFIKLEKELKAICLQETPDLVLLVDYPGFNMRFGRWAKSMGIPVVHYIAPQMWAWGGWRINKLGKSTDLLLVLFPFEERFFGERGIRTEYVGHPLKNIVHTLHDRGDAMGIIPGSRAQEVKHLLPPMLGAFEILKNDGVVQNALVAVSAHLEKDVYRMAASAPGVKLVRGTQDVFSGSRAAAVCSGTATLETALAGVPFVICYKTGGITYALAKSLVKGVNRIGLANIVAGEDVAVELIQNGVSPVKIAESLRAFFVDDGAVAAAEKKLGTVSELLGDGDPARNAAASILSFLGEQSGS